MSNPLLLGTNSILETIFRGRDDELFLEFSALKLSVTAEWSRHAAYLPRPERDPSRWDAVSEAFETMEDPDKFVDLVFMMRQKALAHMLRTVLSIALVIIFAPICFYVGYSEGDLEAWRRVVIGTLATLVGTPILIVVSMLVVGNFAATAFETALRHRGLRHQADAWREFAKEAW